jgi:zinc/manganese transport system substrate-binding protein
MFRFLPLLLGGLMALPLPIQAGQPVKVASLSTVLTDLVKQVGGDRVQVSGLVKPGVDPHDFQPAPDDVKKVAQADLILASGLGMEGYLTKLETSSGGKGQWIEIGNKLNLPKFELEEDGAKVRDPHWFHSITAARQAVDVIREALSKLSPADKDYFTQRATAYQAKLDALEKWAKVQVASLPRDQRKLVTSHDAFQYFAREFGFTIYSIAGVSSQDQPSSKKVADLIRTIQAQKVKAVFFENIENPKVIAELTRETGAKVGGELYADGLGDNDSDASTYEGMIRHNITTVVDALK